MSNFTYIPDDIVSELFEIAENKSTIITNINKLANMCEPQAMKKKKKKTKESRLTKDEISARINTVVKLCPILGEFPVSALRSICDSYVDTIQRIGPEIEINGKKIKFKEIIPLNRDQYRDRGLIFEWIFENLDSLQPLFEITEFDNRGPEKVTRNKKSKKTG